MGPFKAGERAGAKQGDRKAPDGFWSKKTGQVSLENKSIVGRVNVGKGVSSEW